MIPPQPWGKAPIVIKALRPVTDPLQYALDFGVAASRVADDAASRLLEAPVRASVMAESSAMRTYALCYLRKRHPELGVCLDEIPNDGIRFRLGSCTLSVWKGRPGTRVPYPTSRMRRRIVMQGSLFEPEIAEAPNLVLLYKPTLEEVQLDLILPTGEITPGDQPWEGEVHHHWSATLEHPADRPSAEAVGESEPEDLPIERDNKHFRKGDQTG